ncbi:hypothetical protein Agub_g6621, partial [Astrephomene gubernaculifera]
ITIHGHPASLSTGQLFLKSFRPKIHVLSRISSPNRDGRSAAVPSTPWAARGTAFTDQQLLRSCLARHVLQRLVDSNSATSLGHLGITALQVPEPPPAFLALESALVRAARHGQLGETLQGFLDPPFTHVGYMTPSGRRCLLTPSETVQCFSDPCLEAFLLSLFTSIEHQRAPMVTLSPHCLFHAHLFLAHQPAGGVGLLFHACEYPRFDELHFPYRLGHCQEGSKLSVTHGQLAQRNLLWYQGQLVLLDVTPGFVLRHLLWEETSELCTLYEED